MSTEKEKRLLTVAGAVSMTGGLTAYAWATGAQHFLSFLYGFWPIIIGWSVFMIARSPPEK